MNPFLSLIFITTGAFASEEINLECQLEMGNREISKMVPVNYPSDEKKQVITLEKGKTSVSLLATFQFGKEEIEVQYRGTSGRDTFKGSALAGPNQSPEIEIGRSKNVVCKYALESKATLIGLGHAFKTIAEDVNGLLPNDETLISWASRTGQLKFVKVLIAKGVNVNLTNLDGSTALLLASGKGFEAIVQELLENKADVNLANEQGYSAILLATLGGHRATIHKLIENGSNINHQDKLGRTALMVAGKKGDLSVVKSLIQANAVLNLKRENGMSAITIAKKYGHAEVVNALLDAGATDEEYLAGEDLTPSSDIWDWDPTGNLTWLN